MSVNHGRLVLGSELHLRGGNGLHAVLDAAQVRLPRGEEVAQLQPLRPAESTVHCARDEDLAARLVHARAYQLCLQDCKGSVSDQSFTRFVIKVIKAPLFL